MRVPVRQQPTGRRKCEVVILTFLLLLLGERCTQADQLWHITPTSPEQLELLLAWTSESLFELDVWKSPSLTNKAADILIPTSRINDFRRVLKSRGIPYSVSINNVDELINGLLKKSKLSRSSRATSVFDFDYSVYHPANEIEEWMDFVVKEYDFVTKFQIGVTYNGRKINALNISKPSPDGKEKPAIYVDALIHPREWITAAATMLAFKEILSNSTYSRMLEKLDWYYIPMINIDGYLFTWEETGDRLWRKTRSGSGRARCIGVDANRNWDEHWQGGETSSIEPGSALFQGQFPASESEIRHLARFITSKRDQIKAVLTIHSYQQVIIFPYNYAEGQYPSNKDEQNSTAEAMSKAMYAVHGAEYKWGAAAEILYVAYGVTTDWTQAVAEIDINYTIELRDTGQYGFLLPEDQIIPTGEELLAGLVVLADHVDSKYTT